MDYRDRNVLLNILSVLKRMSDKDFILNYWGNDQGYSSIITSCREALAILDDYSFFDLLTNNYGLWSEIMEILPKEVGGDLVLIAKKIIGFDGANKPVYELINDESWRGIMVLSEKISKKLERFLDVENDSSYLI